MQIRRRLARALGLGRSPRQSEFVFVHINKNGGSSIERALGLRIEHKTALEKIGEIGREAWDARFTFAFVRNPWDRVVSHYRYRVKTNQTGLGEGGVGFAEWVALAYGARDPRYCDHPKMFMPQSDWITDASGNVLVQFVGRFESLPADFEHVKQRLGIAAELPHVKASTRGPYRDYYEDQPEARRIVAQAFAADIQRFEYSF